MSDLVLVPYADAMLIPVPDDRRPDRHRVAVGQHSRRLARGRPLTRRNWPGSTRPIAASWWSAGCRSGCTRPHSAAALGAHVDYVDTDPQRLAAAEKLGAVVHDAAKPDKSWDPYPVTVHTSADPALLAATLRATWPDGVCTDTGIYFQTRSRCRCCRCTPAV